MWVTNVISSRIWGYLYCWYQHFLAEMTAATLSSASFTHKTSKKQRQKWIFHVLRGSKMKGETMERNDPA
jgi:hypothetical protein